MESVIPSKSLVSIYEGTRRQMAEKTPFKKRNVSSDLHNMSTALSKEPLYFAQRSRKNAISDY